MTDTVRGNICLFPSESTHALKMKASASNNLFTTEAQTKCLPLAGHSSLCWQSLVHLLKPQRKMTATAANTEQVFPLPGARSFTCIISFHPHHRQQRGHGQDPWPCNSIVQRGLQTKCSPQMWYNTHLGAKRTSWGQVKSFFTPLGTEIIHLSIISRCWARSWCGCYGISFQARIPKHIQLQQFQTRISGATLHL